MYRTIQLTNPKKNSLNESHTLFTLDPFLENQNSEESMDLSDDIIFTEAVFTNGKEAILPIVDHIAKIKQLLLKQIREQEESKKNFDPNLFWKSLLFKDLEDTIATIFGFRNVQIHPYNEKYLSATKGFESKIMNCSIYTTARYPIEGLVTDHGFYDKSKSSIFEIYISLGLIKELEPDEITAVMLHEFGHSIDPAIVDIKYLEVNILSKYLTDRKKSISKSEQKLIHNYHKEIAFIPVLTKSFGWNFHTFISNIQNVFMKNKLSASYQASKNINSLFGFFMSKKKKQDKQMEQLRKLIESDKNEFNKQNFSEAFADNFARMYGFGPQLIRGFKKMSSYTDKQLRSRYKKEKERQKAILDITKMSLNDEHRTNIHRIRALLKEYRDDLKDPNIPDQVKKQLKEDMDELNKVLDEYLNHFDEFQARINKTINDELMKLESASNVNESVEYSKECTEESMSTITPITESKKAWEKMKKEINAITSTERNEFYKLFGKSYDCSLAKDKDGYYVRTHRCRSKSYKEIKDIPEKDVKFVRSTS